ncbi:MULTISPECIES: hypothetical protein [Paenibacillus]|uniref:hypothetical protein n=1 Tax=Paenibacillus TaxID=44249 RepID=UPI0013585F10|nr:MULTISPECIES: hypothetical protein [Paenibacillus]
MEKSAHRPTCCVLFLGTYRQLIERRTPHFTESDRSRAEDPGCFGSLWIYKSIHLL